ncbi:unnamed protein product [Toxocara canis]|uniref:Integrase catalytic domain-containing protein n=1 Tax=Toxocara canis TaxID=6265 RepID=A0A183UQM2_TOXCA|nr:unnamed protein product [Toxocara canis]
MGDVDTALESLIQINAFMKLSVCRRQCSKTSIRFIFQIAALHQTFNSAGGRFAKVQRPNYLLCVLEDPTATVVKGDAGSKGGFELIDTAMKLYYGNPAVKTASLNTELQNNPCDNGSQPAHLFKALKRTLRQLGLKIGPPRSSLLAFAIEQKCNVLDLDH